MSLNNGAKYSVGAYSNLGLRTDIESASPHRLILMLLDGATEKIRAARFALECGEVAAKGANVSWAMSIVDGLRASLHHDAGGDLATNLDHLYDYINRVLLDANLHNDPAKFSEALTLLGEIRGAWIEMRSQVESGEPRRADNDLGSLAHAIR